MNNWLITGGCGFLGIALIKKLLKDPENNIRVLDNLSVGTREDLGLVSNYQEQNSTCLNWDVTGNVSLVVGDIIDEELAFLVANDADVIVHFAANTGVGSS